MNRRYSLRYLFASSGLLISLPVWAQDWSSESLNHSSTFSPDEQGILTSVADTIIPTGNGLGAISVGVDKFLQKLIDECYLPEVQSNIKSQLAALDSNAQKNHSKNFAQCTQKDREALLLAFSSSTEKHENDFFKLMKSETIRGYNTSKEVMTQLKYKVAPGHYYGCVDVKA